MVTHVADKVVRASTPSGKAIAPVPGHERTAQRSALGPIAAWIAIVTTGAVLVHRTLVAPGAARLDAAPLHGAFDPRVDVGIVAPVFVAAVAVLWAFRVARTASWRGLLLGSWALAATWAVSLAGLRGWGRLTAQLERPGEYLAVLARIDSLGVFLGSFVDDIARFPVHVQGHPPGFVLVAWALQQVGLSGSLPISLLCIAVGASAVPAALLVVRGIADANAARRAAPFVAVAPAAIWTATSADAFFAGVGAWAVTLVVLAVVRVGRRRDACAVGGGLLFGATAFLSYGLVLLALIPLVIAFRRRCIRPILIATGAAFVIFTGFLLVGFWWVDGLLATRDRYFAGIASRRPYELFLVANLSSFAIMLGPAVAVALWRLRDRRLWLVVGGALLAVAIADLSGMSKSEVERIWLPFAPWVLVGCAALSMPRSRVGRGMLRVETAGWLAVQATFAILLESMVRTGW